MRVAVPLALVAALGLGLVLLLRGGGGAAETLEPGASERAETVPRAGGPPAPEPRARTGQPTRTALEADGAVLEDAPAPAPPLEPGGLRVRVVDADGAPVAGVAVELGFGASGFDGTEELARGTTRAPDGLVRLDLEQVEELKPKLRAAGLRVTAHLTADVASAAPVRLTLDDWPVDGEQRTLELPATGSVFVRVLDHGGGLHQGHVSVGWWWLPADVAREQPDSGYERVPDHLLESDDGAVRIEGLGLGLALQLNAWAEGCGPATARGVEGPTEPGEQRVVELQLGPPNARVRLRVLDLAGRPLAHARLSGELWPEPDRVPHPAAGPPRPSHLTLATDSEGFVEVQRAPGLRDVAPRLDLIHRPERDERGWSVASVMLPTELAAGELAELDDARLAPVPVVAEGRVVDLEGRPIAGARLWFLERFGETPEHRWHNLGRALHTDLDGRFLLRDDRLPRALGVQVSAKRHETRTLHDLVPGDRAIEVVLEPAAPPPPQGAFAVHVLLDEPSLSMRLLLRVRRPEGGGRTPDWMAGGRMEVDHLAPGTYDVWVETREGGLELGRVEGVLVRAGEVAEDPRLLPFDLRGALRHVRLEVVRPDGSPWRRRELRVEPLVERASIRVETDDEGRASFLVPSSIARVWAGFDAEHVAELALGGGGDVLRVVLEGE